MTQENRWAFPSEETRKERMREYHERKQRKLEIAKKHRLKKKELEKKILDFKIPIIECPLGCRPFYLAVASRDCEVIYKQLGLDWRDGWYLAQMTLYQHLESHHAKEEISTLLCQMVIETDEKHRVK